jgi:hypothetical protein
MTHPFGLTGRLPAVVVLSLWVSTAALAAPASVLRSTGSPSRSVPMELGGLSPGLYRQAQLAYDKVQHDGHARRERLVVIDYTRPSTEQRLWVFDLHRQTLLFKELVAHGKNTGDVNARTFSNVPGSLQTSVGVFVTNEIYQGKHGKSLRLDGLELGFNDRARERAIVIHGADYVGDRVVRQQGRLGRSWGCPALATAVASEVIDAIADGAVVFAWGNDPAWVAGSTYLH